MFELSEVMLVKITARRDTGCVCLYMCVCKRAHVLPEANPVRVTTSHPDQASYRLLVNSHADSFFLLLIYMHAHTNKRGKTRIIGG